MSERHIAARCAVGDVYEVTATTPGWRPPDAMRFILVIKAWVAPGAAGHALVRCGWWDGSAFLPAGVEVYIVELIDGQPHAGIVLVAVGVSLPQEKA